MAGLMKFPLVVVYMAEGVGNAPTSAMPILFSGQVQPAYISLPSKMAARVGLAPTPHGLTGRRATLTLSGNWLFIVRGIRRLNSVTWCCRQDSHLHYSV